MLQKMGLRREEVVLEVNTMTRRTVSTSRVIKVLYIQEHTGKVKIRVVSEFSKDKIPAERQFIPRRETGTIKGYADPVP